MGTLACPADEPHELVDRWPLNLLAAQELADPRQQQGRTFVLERHRNQMVAKLAEFAFGEGLKSRVGADEKTMLGARTA